MRLHYGLALAIALVIGTASDAKAQFVTGFGSPFGVTTYSRGYYGLGAPGLGVYNSFYGVGPAVAAVPPIYPGFGFGPRFYGYGFGARPFFPGRWGGPGFGPGRWGGFGFGPRRNFGFRRW
jgi:hypothetical protein